MSKLDELIKEYCPDGVIFKTLEECTLRVSKIRWKESNEWQQRR